MAWLAKHEYERAIADFTQATKFEHENYLAYVHRAEANEQKGDRDSAIADYRRALALAPDKTISDQINAALKQLNPPCAAGGSNATTRPPVAEGLRLTHQRASYWVAQTKTTVQTNSVPDACPG